MDLVGTEDVVLRRINFYDSCSPMTLEALMQFETHPQELRHFTAVILSLLNILEKDITSRKRRPNSSFHLDTCKTWRQIFSAILISKPLDALFPAVSVFTSSNNLLYLCLSSSHSFLYLCLCSSHRVFYLHLHLSLRPFLSSVPCHLEANPLIEREAVSNLISLH